MKYRNQTFILYPIIILLFISSILSLPFLSTTISIKSTGIIRPESERTQVKAIQSGIIDSLFFKEGQTIKEGAVILKVKDYISTPKMGYSNSEINRIRQILNDLHILSNTSAISDQTVARLHTSLYKEQLNRYLNHLAEQKALLAKAEKEYDLYGRLHKDKVISDKEFFDYENALQRVQATYKAFTREQKSQWYQQITDYQSQLNQLQQQRQLTEEDTKTYFVNAPVSGIVQGIQSFYAGGVIQTGEVICTISPESTLIGECYVTPKDIGLLRLNQPVIYQIDAFDYNLFGTVTGKIISIDNDYTMTENMPVFKVRCSFDTTVLSLKNGYTGNLKKGLTFQSRFVIGRRTLWQLLWDKMDDWLNPIAPTK